MSILLNGFFGMWFYEQNSAVFIRSEFLSFDKVAGIAVKEGRSGSPVGNILAGIPAELLQSHLLTKIVVHPRYLAA